MPSTRVHDRLQRAAADGRLVRMRRRKGWDRLDGAVVGGSGTWVVLAVVVEAGFDGYALLRRADVRGVEKFTGRSFHERALALEGHWPLPPLPGVDLTSTRVALQTLADAYPLVAVYYEQDHPNETMIGVPRDLGRKKFRLQSVNPSAEWDGQDEQFRYRSVSRLDVGGAYASRLAAVAGPAPDEVGSSPSGTGA